MVEAGQNPHAVVEMQPNERETRTMGFTGFAVVAFLPVRPVVGVLLPRGEGEEPGEPDVV